MYSGGWITEQVWYYNGSLLLGFPMVFGFLMVFFFEQNWQTFWQFFFKTIGNSNKMVVIFWITKLFGFGVWTHHTAPTG